MRMNSIILGLSAGLLSSTAFAGDVRVMWYSDGVEGEVIQDLLNRFVKDNPGINVILDNVAYKVIQEQLPVELEAGRGPDIARVTNIKELADHWLDLTPVVADPAYWQTNFGDQFDWMRPDGSKVIPGFMTQITLTGGFVNKTLFEQAGVPIPAETATWDEWIDAAGKVQQSQQLNAAFAIDRSGHRISAPNISYGANYIGSDRLPAPIDAGTKAFAEKLVNWVADGRMNKEIWVSASGTTYRAGADDFINGQIAYYYSGSWQVANLAGKIGKNFDWVATGSPCGPAACTGMPGGAALVAIKYTKNAAEVGKVMDFLGREDIVREFTERTLFLPVHKGVLAGKIDYKTDDDNVKASLEAFLKASGKIVPNAAAMPAWKWGTPVYGALVTRISQVMAGEMKLDEAFVRIDEDIKAKVAEASK
ncbi:MAG: carbohydrate ABC transporter substrate-binding protein [Mesorhizobium sp.]|uniref:ABC transporter substrate-binding protein n=1 Tax=Mesorhizobium sp. TaxID=1871066 RepID=UPI000FE5AF41|nr:ABC transporter substrate-binding protein [Mesorhizobium sp.]RWC35793.1 MAG: carbohydrate ABC transporter substrate-binding protein [Mesorhizobium sp.]